MEKLNYSIIHLYLNLTYKLVNLHLIKYSSFQNSKESLLHKVNFYSVIGFLNKHKHHNIQTKHRICWLNIQNYKFKRVNLI